MNHSKETVLKTVAELFDLVKEKQSKVDELTKQLIGQGQRFNEQSQQIKDLKYRNDDLQKRVDAAKTLIEEYRDPPTKDKTFQHALSIVADELEQALKGGENETN